MDHGRDDCTGDWKLAGEWIQCERCGVSFPATPQHRMEATDQNYIASLLRQATANGAALLRDDSET